MIDVVASLPVTSAAIARRRIQAERGIRRRALRRRRPAEPIPGARLQRRHLAADAGQRFEATDRAGNGRRSPVRQTTRAPAAVRPAAPPRAPLLPASRTASARARPPSRPRLPTARRLPSCSARSISSACTWATASGVRASCASAQAASARMPTPSPRARRDAADQLGLLEPSERANAGDAAVLRLPSPRGSGRHCACPRR